MVLLTPITQVEMEKPSLVMLFMTLLSQLMLPVVNVEQGLYGNIVTWTHAQEENIENYIIQRCCNQQDTLVSGEVTTYIDQIDGRLETSSYRVGAIDILGNNSLLSINQNIDNILIDQPCSN